MTAPIDSSRPYKWPSELVQLVEAVTQTDPQNESTWIEWKSTLDLDDKSGHFHIAKHVLGFANRTVSTAGLHAEGLAYLIVGAEPGNVAGVAPSDPAVLRPRIERYVGPAVRWRAEYLTVQGKQVLVVIVDPPLNGDPIHPVRQQLDKHPKGTILVRRQGSTDPANEFEIDQLSARVRADKGGLGISLHTASAVIEQHPGLPDADERTEAELAATLARPRADVRPPGLLGSAATGNWDFILGAADERSKEDYENEVRRYGELYKRAIQEQAVWRLWRHEPICLALEMVNLTDDNFAGIEVEVHIPGKVRTWPEDIEDIAKGPKPVLPDRPAVLGTRTPYVLGAGLNFDPTFGVRPPSVYLPPPVRGGPYFTARDSGSVTIDFGGIDLRPHQRAKLPRVRLLVTAPEGEVLACTWKATASNVSGQLKGSFSLTVRASTLDYDEEAD